MFTVITQLAKGRGLQQTCRPQPAIIKLFGQQKSSHTLSNLIVRREPANVNITYPLVAMQLKRATASLGWLTISPMYILCRF